MKLTHLSHDAVLYVAMNMRQSDREEIYNLRWEENPFVVMQDTMLHRNFAWVAWVGETPCAVFGGAPRHPGVWEMFMYATDDLPKIGLALTRFAVRTAVPTLRDLGAHRLQADSHSGHTDAHKWLAAIGASVEGVKRAYGKDGADYWTWVLHPAQLDKPDKVC